LGHISLDIRRADLIHDFRKVIFFSLFDFMTGTPIEDDRPGIPAKIGCRVCMGTAKLSERFGEAPSGGPTGKDVHGTLSFGIYRCDEGHVTHAAFDSADGSLRIYEPENPPPEP